MKYTVRKGVVLRDVCGEYLLIATLDAQKYCPYSTVINEDAAFVWRLAAAGESDDEIISAVALEYEAVENEVEPTVRELLGQMVCQGFLIER